MTHKIIKLITASLLMAALIIVSTHAWANVTGKPHDLSLDNPKGHCINCHDLHQPDLGKGFEHNLKRQNEIAVCYQCHAGTLNSYSSIDKSYLNYTTLYSRYDIRSEFSQQHIHFPTFGMDGEHNKCSYCHNPHGVFDPTSTTRKPKLLSAGIDAVTDTDEFCLVCHNSDTNPPHLPFANVSVGARYRFSRTVYKQMKHSTFVRATSLNEPFPDTAHTYDDNPYGKGKDISCLTCHRPHGSPNDHMLKSADDQSFCLTCHDGSKAPDLTQFNTTGHGKPDVGRTCQECHFPHGTGQQNAIKKTITDPHTMKNMTADVTGKGVNEACYACHNAAGGDVPIYFGFDGTAAGWTPSGLTQSISSTVYYAGSGALKQQATGYNCSYTGHLSIQPNTSYAASAYLNLPSSLSGGSAILYVYQYNSSNGYLGNFTAISQSAATSGWKRFTYSFTSSPSASNVVIYLYLTTPGTAYWDEVQIYRTQAGAYYRGKAAYSAGIHKTSPNAQNPAVGKPAGDCDNCHDPHGKGNQKMLVDPDENLCYDCHNAATPNTVSGRDVQAAFLSASRHDLSRVKCVNCHNVHNATQAAVTMDPFNQAAVIAGRSDFCLSCHSGTMPSGVTGAPNVGAEWTGGGHDRTHLLTCSDCHDSHGSPNAKTLNARAISYGGYTAAFAPGLSFSSRGLCEACHNRTGLGYKGAKMIPTGDGYVTQHTQGDSTPCSDCHSERHNPALSSYTTSTVYYSTACLNCHTQGTGNPYPNADTEFNTPAIPNDANTEGSTHALIYNPPSQVDCVACHGAKHETDHSATKKVIDPDPAHPASGSLDVSVSSAFCLQCHDATPVSIGGQTPPNIMDTYTAAGHGMRSVGVVCSACHTHHGSVNAKLLRTVINGLPVLSIYSGDNVSVCIACHKGTAAGIPDWPGYSTYSGSVHALGNQTTGNFPTDGRHGRGTCVNCHNPHGGRDGGRLTDSMTRKKEENLCFTCHNGTTHNTASGDDVQARFGMRSHHRISDADQLGPDGLPGTADDSKVECFDCHDPHTITEKKMVYGNVSGKVVPLVADQDFCLKCHNANPPTGIKFPQGGVWDKSQFDSSAHGNPMKRLRTFGNYSNGIRYACKVCHNPHGSDQVALQRESWDIDRDGLPDDIDGDGILDSSDMVGFIGYSTGTRKPMLVKVMDGIPSRASFKRVSTTIPKQGNGSIDIELCLNCHDGSPAYDVRTDIQKASHHPVEYAQQVALGGAKISCYNCHDQHRAQARNDERGEYPTTNPFPPREPMPGDAKFCLKCHDNNPPDGVSFGSRVLKNIKLSYNPNDLRDAKGYDLITTGQGHFVQATGAPLMCRVCHNQHGSNYPDMLRDNTEPGKPGYDPAQPIQGMQPVTLAPGDAFGGGDSAPLSTPAERCLACHSGGTTYNGSLIPLPPPPDAAERNFTMSSVGKHPDLKADVTQADEVDGHIYKSAFAVITTPGSVKEACTTCHDSHDPIIKTVDGELMDCYQCHNANTSLPDVQTEFNDNPLNPARSKSMHMIKYDPSGGTPSYVECLKCHDQTKHMQGKVRLRKDPTQFVNYTSDSEVWTAPVENRTVNQFCLECHAPDSAVAASFWRGGGEHVPPRLPAAHAAGAHFTDGNLLCTDCHEYHGSVNKGLRKNARGDEETFCYSCHDSPANSMEGVDIKAKFTGSGSRHQVDSGEQAASGSKVECESCHNPHVVNRASPVVQPGNAAAPAAADDSFCIGCHGSTPVSGIKFPGFANGSTAPEWDAATGKWNKWNKAAYSGSPHEDGGVGCRSCHDPHGSPNYDLLLPNISTASGISVRFGIHSTLRGKRKEELGVNQVCASCHKDAMGVYNGYGKYTSLTFGRKNVDKNCTYCHNPHGTGQAKLIRSNKTLYMNMTSANFGSVYNFKGFANGTTAAPYCSFCSSRSCHASEKKQIDTFNMELPGDGYNRDGVKSSHHPVKEGILSCTSCHAEHGTSTKASEYLVPDLRAPFFRGNNWPAIYHSGKGLPGGGNGYGGGSGGDGTNYFLNNTPNTATPPDNANDLCFMCHMKDDIVGTVSGGMAGTNTKFLGHEAVKGGAYVSHNISPQGNVANSDYHNFSCSACHFPHSSSQVKLLKVGCMSQNDSPPGGSPLISGNDGQSRMFSCHAYTGWPGYSRGWRNITTSKADFKRPPNAVADLSATVTADLAVDLSWTAVADQPGAGADHYNVYRSSQPITQAAKPGAVRIFRGLPGGVPGAAMGYEDKTAQPNTTYYYAIVACDQENNESFVSNTVPAVVGPDATPPAAISDQQVRQQDGTLNVVISWHDPGDNINVTQYKVYRIAGTTPLAQPDIAPGNLAATVADASLSADGSADNTLYSWTDTSGSMGTQYSYAVIAMDAAGNASALPTGSVFGITVGDPPPAAVSTLAVRPEPGSMKADLTWSAPADVGAISGYNVYRKAGATLTQSDLVPGNLVAASVSGTSYTDTAPLTGTAFCYAVTAIDQSSSKESGLGNVVPMNIPDPPSGITLSRVGSVLRAAWTAPAYTTGLSGYNVYVRRSGGAWTKVAPSDNLAPNGGFERGLYGWQAVGLSAYVDGTRQEEGVYCTRLAGTYAGDKYLQTGLVNALPSTVYTFTGYVNVPAALTGGTTSLRVIEYNASGGYVTEHTYAGGVSSTAGWQKLTDTWTTNAQTARLILRLQLAGSGIACWDDVRLTGPVALSTSAKVDLTGSEPGSYDVAVSANYGTYLGTSPYESVMSQAATAPLTDTACPDTPVISGGLTQGSNYNQASLTWNTPPDANFSGYAPTGLGYYQVKGTYDGGATWKTLFETNLPDPSFESFSGTVDDASTDFYSYWQTYYTYVYAVTDALFDNYAMKIKDMGYGTGYVYSSEPNTGQSVANKTYSVSFWAKANKNTTFQYLIQENGGTLSSIAVTNAAVGTSWQRFTASGAFSSGASATSARAVIKPSYDTSAEIVLDGVRLEQGTNALLLDDGSYCQPAGYDAQGSPQSYTDPSAIVVGTAATYRVCAYDAQGNPGGAAFKTITGKPAAIDTLNVTSLANTSGNQIAFGTPASAAGLTGIRLYAKAQASPLTDITGATLIGTVTPQVSSGSNLARSASVTASSNQSVAAQAIDGNTGNYWYGSYTNSNILELDFTPAKVVRVAFLFQNDNYMPKDYQIQTWDGAAWQAQVTVTGNTSQNPSHMFAAAVPTGKVRMVITDTRGGYAGYCPHVAEFMLYPGESFTHDMQNAALPAQPGVTYAYAAIADDAAGISSDMSSGPSTVRMVLDRDAPVRVGDLAASSEPGTDTATLTWTTPADNFGLGVNTGAATYQVYRTPSSITGSATPITDANFNDIGVSALVYTGTYVSSQPGTANSYTSTWYDHTPAYFAVRSADASGNWSIISNSPYIVVGKDTQAPTPPVILSCTSAASPEVDVTWSPAVDNTCVDDLCGVNGYRLFRADSNAEPFRTDGCINENNVGLAQVAINLIPYNYTQIADNGGAPGTTYFYALRAWDNEGNMSSISNCGVATVATVATDTTPPVWGGASPLIVQQMEYPDIDLSWAAATDKDDSGGSGTVDRYEIYRSLNAFTTTADTGVTKIAAVSGVKSSYIDKTGDHDTAYYYGVVPVDASANQNKGALSNVASATVAPAPSPDNVKPSVPGAFTASSGVYPNINLAWTASTDVDDAGSPQPLLYYKLYRADYPQDITDANKNNAAVVKTFILPNDASGYALTGIGDMEYNFRLEAFDMAGNGSGLSNQAMVRVASAGCVDTTPPTAPANLLAVVGPSPDMGLSWTASAYAGVCAGGAIDHYHLYRSTEPIIDSTVLGSMTPITVGGNSTSYTDSSGAPNATYWYVLTAVDTAGNESGRSNVITMTTAADTMAPAAISDLDAAAKPDGILLTWCRPSDNVGINHYEIYRKEQGTILLDADIIDTNRIAVFVNGGACLSYNDPPVLSGHTYSYAVIAVDGAGNRSTISRGQHTIAAMPQ